jgi:hypothetical protein
VPKCPECGSEYDDSVEECPQCSVSLVSGEDEEAPAADQVDADLPAEGLVVIETTTDEARVGRIRELLEESGIPCFLSNELFPTEPIPEETSVFIPREMLGDARRLMREFAA